MTFSRNQTDFELKLVKMITLMFLIVFSKNLEQPTKSGKLSRQCGRVFHYTQTNNVAQRKSQMRNTNPVGVGGTNKSIALFALANLFVGVCGPVLKVKQTTTTSTAVDRSKRGRSGWMMT